MQICLSGPIKRFVRFQDEFTYQASTVREGLLKLTAEYPQLKPVLFDEAGSVRKVHRVFINSMPLADLDHAVIETDRVEVITAIAGG